MRLTFLLALLAAAACAAPASAASAKWKTCSKTAGDEAAMAAGLHAAMEADARLRSILGEDFRAAETFRINRALCADFDRDGDIDRAVHYVCCTVSSPAPFAILRNDGGTFAIAYRRLSSVVWRASPRSGRIVLTSPRYSRNDANCCPSRLEQRELFFSTSGRWRATVRVVRARR